MNNLEKSILATIAYFNIFEHPLTLMEVWQWLYAYPEPKNKRTYELNNSGTKEPVKIFDIKKAIDNSDYLKQRLDFQNGFYFLKGRQGLVKKRMERYNIAESKYNKTIRVVKILKFIPYLKMIAVCNNLAFNNAKEESDIDLFIITKSGRLFFTRFFVTLITHLFKMRRHRHYIKDRICLSFYITDRFLNLESLLLKPSDPHFAVWFSQFVPLYDQGIFNKLMTENKWLKNYLPNILIYYPTQRRAIADTFFSRGIKNFGEYILHGFLGDNLEKMARSAQLKRIRQNKQSKLWKGGTDVVVNDNILKFHEEDRRQIYRTNMENIINKLA
jgi:hypothetical protein